MFSLTPALDRLTAMASASHARACALLLAISLIAFLPGFSTLQPLDRDEPRFAQASKQMLETGDFVDIRFQDEARHKKPVGIYWLQSAAVAAGEALGVPEARTQIWLYRLPSLLGAVATVLLTYWALLAFVCAAPGPARRRADGGRRAARRRGPASPRPMRCWRPARSRRWARWREPGSTGRVRSPSSRIAQLARLLGRDRARPADQGADRAHGLGARRRSC